MTASNPFDAAFEFTLGNEGGYVNDPADKGGATNYGITIATLSKFLRRPASVAEVKSLTLDTAKQIYRQWWWQAMGCDQITHTGVAMCMFDIGVVRGIAVPPKYAQQIANSHGVKLAVDGQLGPVSIAAINGLSQLAFVRDFSSMAEQGFRQIAAARPANQKFLQGWINRAHRLLTLADVPDIVPAQQVLAKTKHIRVRKALA